MHSSVGRALNSHFEVLGSNLSWANHYFAIQIKVCIYGLYDKESLLSKILSFQNWQQQTFWTCIFSQGINRFFLFITVECVELWKCCEKKVVENVFGRKKKTSHRGLQIRLHILYVFEKWLFGFYWEKKGAFGGNSSLNPLQPFTYKKVSNNSIHTYHP